MIFNGLILVDKPSGITSHDVVAKVRKIMGTKSVGHCGTLDPLASGLMVLLINEGTKLSQYILEQDKSYRLQVKLGMTTDSFDITGEVTGESDKIPDPGIVANLVSEQKGSLKLDIPIFSAVKVNGKKLYDYAHKGEVVEVPSRVMSFHEVVLEENKGNEIQVFIQCSKGTYIRSWVQELGKKLGCGAVLTSLRRTASTPYFLDNASKLEDLERLVKAQKFDSPCFIPLESALPKSTVIRAKGADESMLLNGLISYDLRARLISSFHPEAEPIVRVMSGQSGKLLALIGLEAEKGFSIKRVFRYPDTKEN